MTFSSFVVVSGRGLVPKAGQDLLGMKFGVRKKRFIGFRFWRNRREKPFLFFFFGGILGAFRHGSVIHVLKKKKKIHSPTTVGDYHRR